MSIVMKFGGTSVADAAAFENVARIVALERAAAPVVVVSAMSGLTDSLLAATIESRVDVALASLQPEFDRHVAVAEELLPAFKAGEFAKQVKKAADQVCELLRAIQQNPSHRK